MRNISVSPVVHITSGIAIHINGQTFCVEPNTPAVRSALEKARQSAEGQGKESVHIAELSVLIGTAGVDAVIAALKADEAETLQTVRDGIVHVFEESRW